MGLLSIIKKCRPILGVTLVCTSAAAGGKNGNGDYLAVAGPTPIRFKIEPPRRDAAAILPSLPMANESGATTGVETTEHALKPGESLVQPLNAPSGATSPAGETPAPNPPKAELILQPAPITNSTSAEPFIEKQQDAAGQMTPQMLLRYLNKDGSREVLVPYPLEFTPPAPAQSSGGSKATYSSPPAK